MVKMQVNTAEKRFHISKDFYGLFFEDINRSGDGCLYPELIRNRAFEDSIPPDRVKMLRGNYAFETPCGWRDQFNNGEGLKKWLDNVELTDIPGWYGCGAEMRLSDKECLNENRLCALEVVYCSHGYIYNVGYKGISIKRSRTYIFYMFAKTAGVLDIKISLASSKAETYVSKTIKIDSDVYKRYEVVLTADRDDRDAVIKLEALSNGRIYIGFTSLMPQDTYKDHGMNPLIMDMLKKTHSRFLRFPGGCIVEGFTKETSMRFSNTIGPVWERPSQPLMWHYRSTNGLGFHEYLQMCEDLDLEAMYVVNCGITCQGRKPEFFEGNELDEMLDETMAALEYAMGVSDSYWGQKRKKAGHPEPFLIKYVEIGNENIGSEYEKRYEIFYKAIKEKYPDIILVSNTHTEEKELPTEIVDEHLYSTAEAFMTAGEKYRYYDRGGPKIFVGEYAVTSGQNVGNLKSALAEAMYLMELERNQDIVKMSAYAPLIQNIYYTSWMPDLIVYDGSEAFGIPSYHMLSMMAEYRGEIIVESQVEGRQDIPHYKGLFGLILYKNNIKVKNIQVNGRQEIISHEILGGLYMSTPGCWVSKSEYTNEFEGHPNMGYIPPNTTFVTCGENESEEGTFSVDIYMDNPETRIDICVWCHSCEMVFSRDETKPFLSQWNAVYTDRCVWRIEDSTGSFACVNRFNDTEFGIKKQLPIKYGEYNRFTVETVDGKIKCFVNGEFVQEAALDPYPVISTLASVDQEYLYLKVLNYSDDDETIEIILDCNVDSKYMEILLHDKDEKAKNSFEYPEKIIPVRRERTGAGSYFCYNSLKNSLSILKLRRTL